MKQLKYTIPLLLTSFASQAALVDLSTWMTDGEGSWSVSADNNTANQSVNGDPTVFYSTGSSLGQTISGEFSVGTENDDDFIGFVLGYNAGEINSATSDFLLIDWKQADQVHPELGTASAGLAISQVSQGLNYDTGAWEHDPTMGVTELARSINYAETGWEDNTIYSFDITFTAELVEVFINDIKELSISGEFTDGGFGFYNFSQPDVQYSQVMADEAPPVGVSEPTTVLLWGAGLAAVFLRRKQKQ
ncbi:PEP-CTERM sorting domain-containing protein [Alteromonas pelagimontana]|uniref:PEP-CTERM sorting domain-containing protein n=1 Tax=Alteromonas pelagimontana TaxID=1858656 RepID=A0A6M4MG80_9ALTE|nr:PEP-CTERM sorting domain-containing protein [Alteromonas pelagimontana]QJR82191.1 PEP-CTERM sorting domain-containing protein [Alteromonas pelagimontana]